MTASTHSANLYAMASPGNRPQSRLDMGKLLLLAALVAGPQGHGEPRQDGGETLPLP